MKKSAVTVATMTVFLAVSAIGESRQRKVRPHPDALPNPHQPGEVDNPKLVPFIVTSPRDLPGIVVDETDAVLIGKWRYSTHTPPYVGLGYLHDQKLGKGKSSVTYTPELPRAGMYEVRLSHCYNIRRATNTPITIRHAEGEATLRINQQETPGHKRLFRSLGNYRFRKGKGGWLRISTTGTDGKYVIADAVQFIPVGDSNAGGNVVRVGILGFDSYQALAFTQLFHKPPADNPDLVGLRVVAAWPGGSPDLQETLDDVERWKPRLVEQGVQIVDSIEDVLKQSDVVMIMSVDGRAHLKLAKQALLAEKPVYIGRPMAASLDDVIEMFQLAERHDTPLFSCSQHRYSPGFYGMRDHPEVGKVQGCDVYGGCPIVPHHPDLFWHAIHSIETLYTIMGPGSVSVTRAHTADTELVTGVWKDGRIGTYRGIRKGAVKYSALVFGDKGVAPAGKYGYDAPVNGVVPKGRYKGYEGVATEIAKFYKTRELPISPSETIELFAFMEAAHESKRRNGVPVRLEEVLSAARKRVAKRLRQ